MSKVMHRFNGLLDGSETSAERQVLATLALAEQVERLADANASMAEMQRKQFWGPSLVEMLKHLAPDPAGAAPPPIVDVPPGVDIPAFGAGYQRGWDDAVDAERNLRALRPGAQEQAP